LKNKLKDVKGMAITTDMWTSIVMDAFIAVTGHYFDKNWGLKCTVLLVKHLPGSHTAKKIADVIKVFDVYLPYLM